MSGNVRRQIAVGGGLLILALVVLYPVVCHPGWWLWSPGADHSDLAVTHWPNVHFTRRSLWEKGRFPLWRPTMMSGVPFAVNPLTGMYYPLNWLFLFLPLLPLEVGFNLSAMIHLWLAGIAMYGWMRRGLGVGVAGGLVAAVAYEISPKLLAHLGAGHVGWVQAWAWLPVVLLASVEMFRATGRDADRWAIVAGGVLAVQFCADARMAAYTLVAAATLVVGPARHAGGHIWRCARRIAVALAVFIGMSAALWLPLLAVLPHTTRTAMELSDAAVWSLPWRYLWGTLLADYGGFHEWMVYGGVSILALAGSGLPWLWRERSRRWWVGWLVGLALWAAWFSLGENGGLFPLLYRLVPGVGLLRVPPRAWVLVVFALATLAGWGLDGRGRPGRRFRAALVAVGTFPPLMAVAYWLVVGRPPLNLLAFGVIIPLALALWYARRVARAPRQAFLCSLWLVFVVGMDLWVVDTTLLEARPPEVVFADGRAAAEWLAARSGAFRIYSPSYSLPQHVAERYGLALADGVDPFQLQVYADYLTRAAGLDPADFGYSVTLPPFPEGTQDVRTALSGVTPDAKRLGRLGVRYVVAAFPISGDAFRWVGAFDGVQVYENRRWLPAPVTGTAEIVLADGSILFQYDPRPVYAGGALTGVTTVGLALWWIVSGKRKEATTCVTE